MKKTIAILLILVIGMVGVFADGGTPAATTTDKTLKLKTEVAQVFEAKLLDAALTTKDFASFGDAENALTSKNIEDGTNSEIGYLYIATNHKPGYTLSISGAALSSTTLGAGSTTILYTINAGAAILDLVGTGENNTSADTGTASALTQMTVTEYPISVTIDSASFLLAQAATDYEADVKFTFTAK